MNTMKKLSIVLTLALPLLLAAQGHAQVHNVEVKGQAAIHGGDVPAARDRAVEDALRKAVEQTLGTMVESSTISENFQLVEDRIYSKASGYVQSYKIIAEDKSDDGVFTVTVAAKVTKGNLSKDFDALRTLLKRKKMPRVLIMVAEQNVGQPTPSYWWGNAAFSANMDAVQTSFMDSWLAKGFKFVDRQALSGRVKVSGALKSLNPSDQAVKAFGLKTGAEIVIVGKAIANDRGAVMGTKMRSVRASLTLRVLRIDNGQIIATSMQDAGAVHIDPITAGNQALTKATKKAADDLMNKIIKVWTAETSGPQTITLTVKKVKRTKFLRKIKQLIKMKVRGVQEIRQRSYSKKKAVLEIDMTGTANNLAEELEEKDFEIFEVEVDEITKNTVTVTVKSE